MKKTLRNNYLFLIIQVSIIYNQSVNAQNKQEPIIIEEQGSFAVGGSIVTNQGTFNPIAPSLEGQTLHGDHAYVFYQIPEKTKNYP